MAYLQTLINAVVVLGVGVLITWVTRTQIGDLRREVKDGHQELKQDIRDLRTLVSSETASVRSDLTQVALAVGAQHRPNTG